MKSIACWVGAPGVNTSATPRLFSSSTSSAGIVPPDRDDDVVDALLGEQLHDPRHERHVRARQNRQTDGVGVLLDHGLDDLLGRLVKTGVDHLHARRRGALGR